MLPKTGNVFPRAGVNARTDVVNASPSSGFNVGSPTLDAECLVSGGKPTIFLRALKVGT